MVEFNDRREHNHRYNPNSPRGMRPEGECPKCDEMREDIRAKIEEQTGGDPFWGLGAFDG